MIKNEHLIPASIYDIVDKYSKATNENEINNYLYRLEATRDYLNQVIMKHNLQKPIVRKSTRRLP